MGFISPEEKSKIQNFIFPTKRVCQEEKLYFRLDKECRFDYQTSSLVLPPHSSSTFDTYFNILSWTKWQKYTGIKDIHLYLQGRGEVAVKLFAIRPDNFCCLLDNQLICLDQEGGNDLRFSLPDQHIQALLFIKIQAQSHQALIRKGYFWTARQRRRDVSLAIITPTFKREKYIQRTIATLTRGFLQKQCGSSSQLIIIDNGGTLSPSGHARVKIIPNKNYGGAGGFARGMLEVEKDKCFTHFVFSDDDILVQEEAYVRLVYFLALLKNNDTCVSGAMLRSDSMCIQHENGATLRKDFRLLPNKSGLDLRQVDHILANEQEAPKDYAAWWFFAQPVEFIQKFGYPLPVFFQWDDIDYSLRLKQEEIPILDLNGVAVWHDPFDNKKSSLQNFYGERNSFFIKSRYYPSFSYGMFVYEICRRVVGNGLKLRYDASLKALWGIDEALKGPQCLEKISPDKLHRNILSSVIEKPDPLPFVEGVALACKNNRINTYKIRWFISLITLNGHLLPDFFLHRQFRKKDRPTFVAMSEENITSAFLHPEITYYDIPTQTGFVTKFSKKNFFNILTRLVKIIFFSSGKFQRSKNEFNRKYSWLTSKKFWEQYLEIEKKDL